MIKIFAPKVESMNEKKARLMGQYPHNVWCPNCLRRMIDSDKADLVGDTLFCSPQCSKEFRLENAPKLRRTKVNEPSGKYHTQNIKKQKPNRAVPQ